MNLIPRKKILIFKSALLFFIISLFAGVAVSATGITIFDFFSSFSSSSYVNVSANPSSGCSPLRGVSLTATTSRSFSGDITYFFDCTNDGYWDKIIATSSNSFTAYYLCNYSLPLTYTAKVKIEGGGFSADNITHINSYSCYSSAPVDIKANGSDGPISIPHNSSVVLSWNSNNVSHCYASGDWSGSKSISGYQSTDNLTSSKTYNLTCSGVTGSNSDSVMIYVIGPLVFTVEKLVSNLSTQTLYSDSVYAEPRDIVSFQIKVTSRDSFMENVIIKDTLPDKIIYGGSLKVDEVLSSGDIISGLNIGNFSSDQTKTITFNAYIAGAERFNFGENKLLNTVLVYNNISSNSDTATVLVRKKAVLGATAVSTGLTNNLFFDSFFLPLVISLMIIFLFKSRIIKWEEWLDVRKKQYRIYKAQKLLQIKIAKIKTKEFLKNFLS